MTRKQHDAHCDAYDRYTFWHEWPADHDEVAYRALIAQTGTEPLRLPEQVTPREDYYVIAKSDSIEPLYWSEAHDARPWVTLPGATRFSRRAMIDHGEPEDGFWMPLERALELEE